MRYDGVNPGTGARNRAIHPLMGQQKRALDPCCLTQRQKRWAQGGRVGETGELVKGGNDKHGVI